MGHDGHGKLAGLVSFGYSGCINSAVFTKVSYYDDWIQERVEPWKKNWNTFEWHWHLTFDFENL